MGRYSTQLAAPMADLAGVRSGHRVIDVGCGPGALTAELVERVGADHVAAVDPSVQFVAAVRGRSPGVDVHQASAESLPFDDDTFDAALAQLVVHFMTDPVGGIREMARVTKSGGKVAACVWDHAGRRAPFSTFFRAATEFDPDADVESRFSGGREGHLVELFLAAGLRDVEGSDLRVRSTFSTFDEWWEPFTLGFGPPGAYATKLSADRLAAVRHRCRQLLGEGPITITAHSWAARGTV
jgi:SAM-dependent methyltransferase